jgi:hypothetical protein
LSDRILQIPFLPHWRVPEFLRGCLAACCLEQDFPIGFHSPIIPREVLLSGTCLVGSCEVIRKLPQWERLADGYSCIAIRDVNDDEALAQRLGAIVRDPHPAAAVGKRGREFALELEQGSDFPHQIERILAAAAKKGRRRRPISPKPDTKADTKPVTKSDPSRFALTQIAAEAIAASAPARGKSNGRGRAIDLAHARKVLARMESAVADGRSDLRSLKKGVEMEIAIAAAEDDADTSMQTGPSDALFRLQGRRWAVDDGDLADLVPVRDPQLRIVNFDFDVAEFRDVRTAADLPAVAKLGSSHVVVFGKSGAGRRDPLLVDGYTVRVLEYCDGLRTAGEIVEALQGQRAATRGEDDLRWIGHLFTRGLMLLRAKSQVLIEPTATTRRDHKAVPM